MDHQQQAAMAGTAPRHDESACTKGANDVYSRSGASRGGRAVAAYWLTARRQRRVDGTVHRAPTQMRSACRPRCVQPADKVRGIPCRPVVDVVEFTFEQAAVDID